MEDISVPIIAGLNGLAPELLLLVPVGLGVTAVTWGVPKAVRFFKRISG